MTWSTRTLVEHLIAHGDIDDQTGFRLLMAMQAADRFVLKMPARPTDLR